MNSDFNTIDTSQLPLRLFLVITPVQFGLMILIMIGKQALLELKRAKFLLLSGSLLRATIQPMLLLTTEFVMVFVVTAEKVLIHLKKKSIRIITSV